MQPHKIAILGAGNMGTALAQILAKQGRRVWLWDYNPKTVAIIKRTGKNQQFLPGVKLSTRILACASMMDAVEKAELVVIACASPYVRSTTKHAVHCLQGRKVVISQIAKGLEEKTFLTMHEVVQSELPTSLKRLVVTLSGPSIAKEFVAGMPTAVVAASQNKAASKLVQQVFESATFKAEISADWKGVALCGALKNVYAIALGMCDGLRLTMNAKAFLLTVALAETKRITVSLGGKRETVYGLAGLGDLLVTGLGEGRNRALGERICKAGHCKFVWEKSAGTVEGVSATCVFYQLCQNKKISAPVLKLVYEVLYKGADPCLKLKQFFAKFSL